jgi:hypothetical protein
MIITVTGRETQKLLERWRVLLLITKNFITKGKKLYVSSLSIISSRELKVVKQLALQRSGPA